MTMKITALALALASSAPCFALKKYASVERCTGVNATSDGGASHVFQLMLATADVTSSNDGKLEVTTGISARANGQQARWIDAKFTDSSGKITVAHSGGAAGSTVSGYGGSDCDGEQDLGQIRIQYYVQE